jgi:Cu/Ag efflux pump CusA
MSAVILGGLTSSTLLNLLVIPPLFARFARVPMRQFPAHPL